ncbi:permease-like cell division protein FtsX [Thalassotalea sp. PS06]|uniref:permease-like cell division protein FtsX n=1 Tax=Thalassotalea sp. PS06 TaxID=2594005 RepID=UPI001161DA4E|nr:permease-like cell division protein FtsX [Thalassotalea sp. PS06]QDP02674.1 cell division protein FtsX [Thalassotalea sp. PS06]
MKNNIEKASPSLITRLLAPVQQGQQLIASFHDLWRTPMASLMTILVLGISLALPATLHLFSKNAERVSAQWQTAAEISVFLKMSVNEASAQNLVQRIKLYPEVQQVRYISADDAMEQFKQLSGFGNALAYLDANPLPITLLVTPTQRHSQPMAAKALLEKIQAEREVQQGKLDVEWLTRLEAIMVLIKDIVFALAALLSFSVVLIIGNTIRLAILNQKDAIAVMKLVGATDGFIQRPYLYTGFWYGVLGGLLASFTVSLLASYLGVAISSLAELYENQFNMQGLNLQELGILLGIAVFLGLLGSYISVRKHIRSIEPNAD